MGLDLSERSTRSTGATEISSAAPRAAKLIASLALGALYLFSQPLDGRGHVSDVDATTVPAWVFIETGSFDLSEHVGENPWFVETDGGTFSNRTPGAIGFATIGYALAAPWQNEAGYSTLPGNAVAVLSSWLAAVLVAATADRLHRGLFIPSLILFGLGTSTWSISAHQLWPHGPSQMAIALAVWLLVDQKEMASGWAFAVAVLVRPPTIILGMGAAVAKSVRDRSWMTLWRVGGPSLLAGAGFLLYTRSTFGSWSPVASYEAVGGFYGLTGVWERMINVLSAIALPRHGVLMWSVWIAVCLVFSYRTRSSTAPGWLAATPLIAGAYIVAHSMFEVASGGFPYNYRYPLEAVTLAAPFLLSALPRIVESAISRWTLLLAGGFAVLLQAGYLFLSSCQSTGPGSSLLSCELFGGL